MRKLWLIGVLAAAACGGKKSSGGSGGDLGSACQAILDKGHIQADEFLAACKQTDPELVRCISLKPGEARKDEGCRTAMLKEGAIDQTLKLSQLLMKGSLKP
jgi:hypothetical protein